jgi:membrane-associated protein
MFISALKKINLILLCKTYKYLFFLLGIILENDVLLITIGYCTGLKYLNVYFVYIFGIIITVTINQILFLVGKNYENSIKNYMENRKDGYLFRKIKSIHVVFDKYGEIFSLIFRFFLGIRLIAPAILGTTSINARKFFVYNLCGAIIWMCIIVGGGYMLSFYCPYEKALKFFGYLPFVMFGILFILILKTLYEGYKANKF